MATKGADTRARILDAAHAMILEKGYAGLSIDGLIGSVGLTKGAFFHHFKNKQALARSLIRRHADESVALLQTHIARASKLSSDPLQRLLIFVGLYEEMFEHLDEPFPGCLFASYIYELGQFDADTIRIATEEFVLSRDEISRMLTAVEATYPPAMPVDRQALADAFQAIFEGAFILSKALREPRLIATQLRMYKTCLEAIYSRR
jgi:TetR/AcrR family transcriptional repressor of nem operon